MGGGSPVNVQEKGAFPASLLKISPGRAAATEQQEGQNGASALNLEAAQQLGLSEGWERQARDLRTLEVPPNPCGWPSQGCLGGVSECVW